MIKKMMLLIMATMLISCNTEKGLQKAINKNGQKESVAYVVAKYPEYFINTTKTDTIRDTIRIEIPSIQFDTIVKFDSTFFYENADLKISLQKLANGKIKVITKIKDRVIEKPIETIVKVSVPCPDVDKLQLPVKETKIQWLYKITTWLLWLLVLVYLAYRIFIKKIIDRLPDQW
jgi:predicted small secreted protein